LSANFYLKNIGFNKLDLKVKKDKADITMYKNYDCLKFAVYLQKTLKKPFVIHAGVALDRSKSDQILFLIEGTFSSW
jgi:hypothetical protein